MDRESSRSAELMKVTIECSDGEVIADILDQLEQKLDKLDVVVETYN